ncbi:GDP-fucose protein O-fucosyltransferase 1-like [Rhopilema esculentum]|uniref:GDP-fucose protein O-fucosyltransferase 1-like n=1 Tax=Rhopilema esculentum TaxID=499914 RepID=UPI0031D43027
MGPKIANGLIICLLFHFVFCQEPSKHETGEGHDTFGPDNEIPMQQFSILTPHNESASSIDTRGYVLYCPCMGRFGNQAEQLLGSLAFAKGLNRTLVLPPFIVYPRNSPLGSERVRFSKWFAIKPLKEFHRVMTMEKFMKEKAPKIWPEGKRYGFCYSFRDGKKCAMKDGNPFGPFWDHFHVSFDGYVDHPGILWSSSLDYVADQWHKRFPPSKYLVYAFQGAPGDYPSKQENHDIQKYIKFSKYIDQKSDEFIKDEMNRDPFVAIHLRNGGDMRSVCDEVKNGKINKLFCSEQCTGYNGERELTHEMCAPSKKEIIRKTKEYLKKISADSIRLFIGTDNNSMIKDFQKALRRMKVNIHVRGEDDEKDDPIIDIAIMSKADYFIGNCVSSFSAFVRRQRTVAGKPVAFFGLD